MKKFIKFFIIALLVVVAVIVTCVIFFNNLNKNKESETSVISFATSETRQTFNTKLSSVSSSLKADSSSDTRFNIMLTTIGNLDSAMSALSTYYIENNGNIKNKDIASSISSTTSLMSLAVSMAKEYEIKSTSTFYNKHLGANDLLSTTAKYIVNYSNLIIQLSNNISGVEKGSDAKFAMIDLYCRVCINEFSNLETSTNNWVKVASTTNTSFINQYFSLTNAQLDVNEEFSINTNKFISAYNACSKDDLAKNLKSNCNSVTTYNENSTNEQVATFYFKKVYGI